MFQGISWATDYGSTLITTEKLDVGQSSIWKKKITLPAATSTSDPHQPAEGNVPTFVSQARLRNTFEVQLDYKDSFSLRHIIDYLRSPSVEAEYAGRVDVVSFLNIILAKAPNTDPDTSRVGQNKFYPYNKNPLTESFELKGGLIALRGYFSSVRPAINRLLVNVNVASGAFYKAVSFKELMREVSGNNEQREAFIQRVKVKVNYTKDGQTTPFMTKISTIAGFARPYGEGAKRVNVVRFGNAEQVTFRRENKLISVRDYFHQKYGISLRFPKDPVLNCGTRADPKYIPGELCDILPGQPYRSFLDRDQIDLMLKFAARPPNLNAWSIAGTAGHPGKGLQVFKLAGGSGNPQDQSVKPFGFMVGTEMITVPGRILGAPQVRYSKGELTPNNASWNLQNVKFVRPGKFRRWGIVVLNRSGARATLSESNPNVASGKIFDTLERELKKYGIDMGVRDKTEFRLLEPLQIPNRQSNDKKIVDFFEDAQRKNLNMLFVVLPQKDTWLYARIKYFGDTQYGIHTICSVGSKLQKPTRSNDIDLMYMGNLALKFNLKGGGISHTVGNTLVRPLDNNTMLVGIDVTHPSPGSAEGAPSISCVVASVDEHMIQWPGSIRTQTGGVEMVDDLQAMVVERLKLWQKKHQKYPSKIIIYRDGVSEGQYHLVLKHELPSFNKAFGVCYGAKEKWPKIAIIVVGKRHHTRFYPTSKEHAAINPKTGTGSFNPLPGTVVDRGIANKVLREFWLQAHQGLQGTARPAHYVVIKDDISFSADELEQFTHHLCYLFNRATKAVSICPPAYYADLLCERGRAYLHSVLAETTRAKDTFSDTSSNVSSFEWNGGVHENMREVTWYV